jgi:hypothetical protein
MWEWQLPSSRAVNMYIATLPLDFGVWHQFDVTDAISKGEPILKFQAQQMEWNLHQVEMVSMFGHIVPIVNATSNMSELGELMNERYPDSPFSVTYWVMPSGKVKFSLRSQKKIDVSDLAKLVGGGGHPNAAGFVTGKAINVLSTFNY